MDVSGRTGKEGKDVAPLAGGGVPMCAGCGYILVGLAEHRCPECGSPFDPEEARTRCLLLPWERPEVGGIVTRFVKTLVDVWRLPLRAFQPLARRADRPIGRVRRLIFLIVLSFAVTAAAESLFDATRVMVTSLRQPPNPGVPALRIGEAFANVVRNAPRSYLSRSAPSLVPLLGYVVAAAGAISWLYRRQGGILSFGSVLAVLLAATLLLHVSDTLLLHPLGTLVAPPGAAGVTLVRRLRHLLWVSYLPPLLWGLARGVAGESRARGAALVVAGWFAAVGAWALLLAAWEQNRFLLGV